MHLQARQYGYYDNNRYVITPYSGSGGMSVSVSISRSSWPFEYQGAVRFGSRLAMSRRRHRLRICCTCYSTFLYTLRARSTPFFFEHLLYTGVCNKHLDTDTSPNASWLLDVTTTGTTVASVETRLGTTGLDGLSLPSSSSVSWSCSCCARKSHPYPMCVCVCVRSSMYTSSTYTRL